MDCVVNRHKEKHGEMIEALLCCCKYCQEYCEISMLAPDMTDDKDLYPTAHEQLCSHKSSPWPSRSQVEPEPEPEARSCLSTKQVKSISLIKEMT